MRIIGSGIAAKTYNGVTYSSAIKMESSTTISFTISVEKTLYMVTDIANGKVKVDGVSVEANGDGIASVKLKAGSHTITKGDTLNVYALIIK